jgi:hypothetical protein
MTPIVNSIGICIEISRRPEEAGGAHRAGDDERA